MSLQVQQFLERSASDFVAMEILRVHELLDKVAVPRTVDGERQSMSQRLEMYVGRPRITYVMHRNG